MTLYLDLGNVEIKVYKRWFRKSYILKRYIWNTRQIPHDGGGYTTSSYCTLHTKTIITEDEFQELRNSSWKNLWIKKEKESEK